jgi:hypothetical protein
MIGGHQLRKELTMIILKKEPTGLCKEETVVVVDKEGLLKDANLH